MLTVKCAKCKNKLFKYKKYGTGRLIYCYYDRIIKYFSVINTGTELKCRCGSTIGSCSRKGIKMKSHTFTYSGKKLK